MTLTELQELLQLEIGPKGDRLNFNALKAAILDLKTEGATGYEYVEVPVSSAEILAMGSTPIELLPQPGAGKYYEYEGIIEYTKNTTAYTFTGDVIAIVGEDTYGGAIITEDLIRTAVVNRIAQFNSGQSIDLTTSSGFDYYPSFYRQENEAIVLTSLNGTDPTLGDGTLLVKIWYKIKTSGTEL